MKKILKLFVILGLVTGLGISLAGCGEKGPDLNVVRGVTDTEIVIGNTVPTGGALGFVGKPFLAAMEATFRASGEIHGRKIKLVVRDDGGDPSTSVVKVKELVEQDKIFAVVGHFGGAVAPTVDYLREVGVPMFYAANGTNEMFNKKGKAGDVIMPIQPLSRTDGDAMLVRGLTNPVYGEKNDQSLEPKKAKIGVLKPTSQGGDEMLVGINERIKALGIPSKNVLIKAFDPKDTAAISAAASAIVDFGPDFVLLPASQAEFILASQELVTAGNTAPVYSSYFIADPTAVPASVGEQYDLYVNSWLDITTVENAADVAAYLNIIKEDTVLTAEEKAQYSANAYAMAGYIAASTFIDSIERMGDIATEDFTIKAYIDKCEAEPFKIRMGGNISFAKGVRRGLEELALLRFVKEGASTKFEKAAELELLDKLIEGLNK